MFAAVAILLASTVNVSSQRRRGLQNPTSGDAVSKILSLQILRAEDERRWDDDLRGLFSARNARVRERAALAAGRIGEGAAVPELVRLLQHDDELFVREMAAFALGEIESPLGADALVLALKDEPLRMRSVEALGKITAALPKEQEARAEQLAATVLGTLTLETDRGSAANQMTILSALTAVLRAKPDNAGPVVAGFLGHSNPQVRANAANTLARLRLKDGNEQLRKLLVSDHDPVVRANAARVLGATEDKQGFDALVEATKDQDSRVRVSAVRALAALKDQEARVAGTLSSLWCERKALKLGNAIGHERDAECLELVTALGRAFQGTDNKDIAGKIGW